jgi:hypothetical protein
MKINRFVAMAAIALLVVGAMGAISLKAFAKGSQSPVTQSDACAQDEADGTEIASAADTDNVELQCGDQSGADGQETVGAADTDNIQEEVGDQSGPDTGVEAPEIEAPAAP